MNSLTQELRSQIVTSEQEAVFWSKIATLSHQRNLDTPQSEIPGDELFVFPDESDMKDSHFLIPCMSRKSLSIAPSMSLSRSIEDAWEESVCESTTRESVHTQLDRSNSKIWKSTPSGWQKRMSYVRQRQQQLEKATRQDETRMALERKLVEMRRERNGLEKVISRLSVRERKFTERMRREEAFLERKYAKLHEETQDLRQSRAELNRKQYELRNVFQLVHQDELTGLQNVRRFKQVAWDCYQKFCHNPSLMYTLIFIDVDFFKEYNDASETGHENGDTLLKLLGQALRECFLSEYCFRRGGDEFVAVLPESTHDQSIAKCAEAQKRLYELCEECDLNPATLSIGVADLCQADKFEDWFKKTEDAMYFVKLRTKNDVCHYSDLTPQDLGRLETHRKDFSSSFLGRYRVQSPVDEEMKDQIPLLELDEDEKSSDGSVAAIEFPSAVTTTMLHVNCDREQNFVPPPTDYAEMMDLIEHWFENYDKQNEGQIHVDWVTVPGLDPHLSESMEQIGVIHVVDVIKVLFEMKDEDNQVLKSDLSHTKRKCAHNRKLLRECSKSKAQADEFIDNLKSTCADLERSQSQSEREKLQLEKELEHLKDRYHQNHNELSIVRNEVTALRDRLRKMSKTSQDPVKRRFLWGAAKESKTKRRAEIESLQRQLDEHQRELDELRNRSSVLEEENSELSATCEDLKRSKLQCIISLSEQIEHMREDSEYFVRSFSPRLPLTRQLSQSSINLLSPRSIDTIETDTCDSPLLGTLRRHSFKHQRSKSLTSIPGYGLPF